MNRSMFLVRRLSHSTGVLGKTILKTSTSINIRSFSRLSMAAEAFQKHEVMPDVVSKAPEAVCEISYGSNKVDFGNVLTPTQVQDPPTSIKWPTEAGAFYTVIMTDPDAPSRKEPKFRQWCHWIVTNIPGCDVDKGETVYAFVGSGPPKDTGLHRYVYLIYRQPSKQTFDWPKIGMKAAGREKFAAEAFATKFSLGSPCAGNLYQAEWDEYVPKLYEKLG